MWRQHTDGSSMLSGNPRRQQKKHWSVLMNCTPSRIKHAVCQNQHALWSGRGRSNSNWSHCMSGWWRKIPLCRKNCPGKVFSYVLSQWAYSVITVMTVWRRRTIIQQNKPFMLSVSERRIMCSLAALTAENVIHYSESVIWTVSP